MKKAQTLRETMKYRSDHFGKDYTDKARHQAKHLMDNIEGYTETIVNECLKEMKKNSTLLNDGQASDKLNDRLGDRSQYKGKRLIISSVQNLNSLIQGMLDEEERLRRADIRDHRRVLFFRVLTAIFMAAVIITGSYIAEELGVNIPLLRIPN